MKIQVEGFQNKIKNQENNLKLFSDETKVKETTKCELRKHLELIEKKKSNEKQKVKKLQEEKKVLCK